MTHGSELMNKEGWRWASVWHLSRVECWSKCSTNLPSTQDTQVQRWCISPPPNVPLRDMWYKLVSDVFHPFVSNHIGGGGGNLSFLSTQRHPIPSLRGSLLPPVASPKEKKKKPLLTLWRHFDQSPKWLIPSGQKSHLKSANEIWRTCHVFNTQTSNATTAQAQIQQFFISFYLMAPPQVLLAHWCEALRCDQAPEARSQGTRLRGTFGTLPSLSRATLRQRRCTINQVFACFCRRNLPGFYAEPHLRVQMRCSWFPIGHLPSYGESAHSVRPFQAVLPRAESPAVILLIPSKKGNWRFRAKRSLRL